MNNSLLFNKRGGTPIAFKLQEGDLAHTVFVGTTGRGMTVVHPCEAFAQRAGFDSWAAALAAMKEGKIVTAAGPRLGKTILDYQLFRDQAQKDGLILVPVELGIVAVGIRESFSPETLAKVEAESSAALSRLVNI